MGAKKGDVFKPGEKCTASGIYKVIHDTVHQEEHEVTVVLGNNFPPCNHCGKHPRFELTHPAHHVDNHKHFR